MGTVATVVLDEVDVTDLCQEGSVTTRLNRISSAQVKINMLEFAARFGTMYPGAGSYLKVYFQTDLDTTPVLYHHGRVLLCETTADENTGYTVFNSSDPLELWQHRPVRDDDGDFSKPAIIETYKYGPQIVEAMVNNSEDTTAGGGGPPPTDAEGPTRLQQGGVAGTMGSADLTGAPVDWPMTMAELASLLISTGTVDVVCVPIEFDASENYGRLELYEGDYGSDLTATVQFQYGMGAYNVRALRWNEDMTNMCNKLWYYLGPRVKTEADPAGDQHWRANIQGDDPGLIYPPGGGLSPPHTSTDNQVGVQDYLSRILYDVRMDIKIFDARGDEATVGRDLYRRLWQIEQWLRAQPQNLIHVTPTRDTLIGEFNIGDLVLVEANTDVKGGFSGAQRIYEYTISWDAEESVPAVGELQVSSDQEGF